jgi:hypothetical protein
VHLSALALPLEGAYLFQHRAKPLVLAIYCLLQKHGNRHSFQHVILLVKNDAVATLADAKNAAVVVATHVAKALL